MTTTVLTDTPDRVDLVIVAGRPLSVLMSLVVGATPVAANTISSVRAQVRVDVDGEQVVHTFTTDDGSAAVVGTGSNPASVRLVAGSAETSEWQQLWPSSLPINKASPQTVVWWDLEVTDTAGEPHQVTAPGTITLIHQVTR